MQRTTSTRSSQLNENQRGSVILVKSGSTVLAKNASNVLSKNVSTYQNKNDSAVLVRNGSIGLVKSGSSISAISDKKGKKQLNNDRQLSPEAEKKYQKELHSIEKVNIKCFNFVKDSIISCRVKMRLRAKR